MTPPRERPKVGYFCSYVPKEIISAFGKVPVRVLPTADKPSEAEAYLPRNFCSLVKVILASFLVENESDLEAVVHADSCDALRRLNDVWRQYVCIDAIHLLDLPRIDTSLGHDYFYHALCRLIAKLEQRWHVELTAQDLRCAIQCYNEQRSLLGELEVMRAEGLIGVADYYGVRRAAYLAMQKALEGTSISRDEIGAVVATGYGRIAIDYADRQVTEISCYAKGINHLHPEVRTIIDIGGQDSKAISVSEDGRVLDFLMNDKCAAGTGRFLEVMAKALELEIEHLGDISLRSQKPHQVSSTCTVFAESEVVTLVAEGVNREDIVAGLHAAIAKRTMSMVKRVGMVPPVAMAGGVAKNKGVVNAIEEQIGEPLVVPPEPQIVGALGAALYAMEGLDSAEN